MVGPNEVNQGRAFDSIRFRHDDRHPRPFPRIGRRIEEFLRVARAVAASVSVSDEMRAQT